jgi:hypothetical protein
MEVCNLVRFARDLFFEEQIDYDAPFPIGVFGTLRNLPKDQGNGKLMMRRKPVHQTKAFLPHFVTEGMNLKCKKGSSAAFELYFYAPDDWKDLIVDIDHLEGFKPNQKNHYYIRTLMKLRILPNDFDKEFYDEMIPFNLTPDKIRDLQIPQDKWRQYPSVPAWVYSNSEANVDVANLWLNATIEENPLIW